MQAQFEWDAKHLQPQIVSYQNYHPRRKIPAIHNFSYLQHFDYFYRLDRKQNLVLDLSETD